MTSDTTTTTTTTTIAEVVVVVLELKKRRPGCTGMFWRNDPTGTTKLASNNDWPRDGAKLKGTTVEIAGNNNKGENKEKWLLVTEILQKNASGWIKAPAGAAMPYEYDNHYYLE